LASLLLFPIFGLFGRDEAFQLTIHTHNQIMKIKTLLLTSAVALSAVSASRGALTIGDIALIGLSGDTKELTFAVLNTISAGEIITFTDSGWNSGAFRGGEGGAIYTFAADTAAGTVITASGTSGTE
jgi:hypothetical protein